MWGIAPSNEGATGWYAVYGQLAATSCMLLVLWRMAGTLRSDSRSWATPLRWGLLMLLAGMLFGTGIAAALAMPAVAWLMLPKAPLRPRAIAAFIASGALLLVIYTILRKLEPSLYGESRIEIGLMLAGVTAIGRNLSMLSGLVAFGLGLLPLGLLPDPLQFPSAAQLVSLAAGVLLIAGGLWRGSAATRRNLLACLLLVVAIYGLIAIARSMFLGFGWAQMVRTPRYHYAPGAVLSLVLAMALGAVGGGWPLSARLKNQLLAAWALGTAAMIGFAGHTIDHFDNDRRETVAVLNEMQAIIVATPPGETVYIPNKQFNSVGFMNVTLVNRFPGTAAIFAIFHADNVVDGRPVVFTTTNKAILAGAARGRRSAGLLRPPPELPPQGAADKDLRP
jgi:hypothetical protein